MGSWCGWRQGEKSPKRLYLQRETGDGSGWEAAVGFDCK